MRNQVKTRSIVLAMMIFAGISACCNSVDVKLEDLETTFPAPGSLDLVKAKDLGVGVLERDEWALKTESRACEVATFKFSPIEPWGLASVECKGRLTKEEAHKVAEDLVKAFGQSLETIRPSPTDETPMWIWHSQGGGFSQKIGISATHKSNSVSRIELEYGMGCRVRHMSPGKIAPCEKSFNEAYHILLQRLIDVK